MWYFTVPWKIRNGTANVEKRIFIVDVVALVFPRLFIFLSRHSSPFCPRSFVRALPSSWRILAWRLADRFAPVNSVAVLVEASRGATPSQTTLERPCDSVRHPLQACQSSFDQPAVAKPTHQTKLRNCHRATYVLDPESNPSERDCDSEICRIGSSAPSGVARMLSGSPCCQARLFMSSSSFARIDELCYLGKRLAANVLAFQSLV